MSKQNNDTVAMAAVTLNILHRFLFLLNKTAAVILYIEECHFEAIKDKEKLFFTTRIADIG